MGTADKDYQFAFMFRFPVNPSTVKYRSTQRDISLIIEKEQSNSYWPHMMPKADKKKSKKGIVDDEDGYGNLAGMGMGGDDESSSDDSDDAPIDDLEVKPDDAADAKEDEEAAADAEKADDKEENKESAEDAGKGAADAVNEEQEALDVD